MANFPPPPQTCAEHKVQVAKSDDGCQKATRLIRAQWHRAAVLGANDGLLSTTSLMLGVGAAKEDRYSMILSGVAGAIAGACSMAVGDFVSVAAQRDIEKAADVVHRMMCKTLLGLGSVSLQLQPTLKNGPAFV